MFAAIALNHPDLARGAPTTNAHFIGAVYAFQQYFQLNHITSTSWYHGNEDSFPDSIIVHLLQSVPNAHSYVGTMVNSLQVGLLGFCVPGPNAPGTTSATCPVRNANQPLNTGTPSRRALERRAYRAGRTEEQRARDLELNRQAGQRRRAANLERARAATAEHVRAHCDADPAATRAATAEHMRDHRDVDPERARSITAAHLRAHRDADPEKACSYY